MAHRVGALKMLRTSSCMPSLRTRSMSATTSSEWPPSSKNWSWRPTRATPSKSCQIAAMAVSAASSGASYSRMASAAWSGCGSALRSSLPFDVRGNSSSRTKAAGTMYDGSWAASGSRSCAGCSAACGCASTYATRRLLPGVSSRTSTTASRTPSSSFRRASISPSSMRKPRSLT